MQLGRKARKREYARDCWELELKLLAGTHIQRKIVNWLPLTKKAEKEMNSQTSKLTKDWSARLEDHGKQEAIHIGVSTTS